MDVVFHLLLICFGALNVTEGWMPGVNGMSVVPSIAGFEELGSRLLEVVAAVRCL